MLIAKGRTKGAFYGTEAKEIRIRENNSVTIQLTIYEAEIGICTQRNFKSVQLQNYHKALT